jgi:hypothetical protein
MSTAEIFEYDDVGKIDLTNIYDRTDPRQYYSTLSRLDYIIPETAKPVFQHIIETYRQSQDKDKVRILDVGCSYGINAAILKGDLEMEHLYNLYAPDAVGRARRDQLLGRDQTIAADLFKDYAGVVFHQQDRRVGESGVVRAVETDTRAVAQNRIAIPHHLGHQHPGGHYAQGDSY